MDRCNSPRLFQSPLTGVLSSSCNSLLVTDEQQGHVNLYLFPFLQQIGWDDRRDWLRDLLEFSNSLSEEQEGKKPALIRHQSMISASNYYLSFFHLEKKV